MALGGGVFVTPNKTLPGSYINFVRLNSTSTSLGERGTVAIALKLNTPKSGEPTTAGTVIEVTKSDFVRGQKTEYLHAKYDDASMLPLREIFCHASKVYVYDLGTDGTATEALTAFEHYDFNVLCAYVDSTEATAYATKVTAWRDEMGKKCQLVAYNYTNADHEGIINVTSTVSNDGANAYALVAWVAGLEAGCDVNKSCTNALYDGELTVVTNHSQAQLETCLTSGQFVFHLVYGEVRVLEDINSLKTYGEDKNEDFRYNQTIRVIDQVANDIAYMFNTKYLGKIPNNASGRVSLWGDIVKHHRELETLQAIENFDPSMLTVEQGVTKKSVVVTDCITVVGSMAQLYMTVVVQ